MAAGLMMIGLAGLVASPVQAQTTTTYQYDSLGRLVQTQNSYGITTGYGYDAAGNRTSQSISADHPVVGNVTITVDQNSSATLITPPVWGSAVTGLYVLAQPPNGQASAPSSTTLSYMPNPGYFGSDSFPYFAYGPGPNGGPQVNSNTAQVYINVRQIAPIAQAVNNYPVLAGSTNNVINPTITGGTATSLQIASQPVSGTTASVSNLALLYNAPSSAGSDSFTYTALNATGSSTAQVSINVVTTGALWDGFNWDAGPTWN